MLNDNNIYGVANNLAYPCVLAGGAVLADFVAAEQGTEKIGGRRSRPIATDAILLSFRGSRVVGSLEVFEHARSPMGRNHQNNYMTHKTDKSYMHVVIWVILI
jgi:hypothetical protein